MKTTDNYYKEVVKRVGAYFMNPGIYSVFKNASRGNELVNTAFYMWEACDKEHVPEIEIFRDEFHGLMDELRTAFIRATDEDGF